MIESFIPRLSLSNVWAVFRGHIIPTFVQFIVLAVFVFVLSILNGFLKESPLYGGFSELNRFLKDIPWWVYTSIALSFFFWWLGKGVRVVLPFPLIDFQVWLFLTMVTFASFASIALLPLWLGLPLFYFLNPLFYMEQLIEIAQNKNLQNNE